MSNPVVQSINPVGASNALAHGTISCQTNAGFTQQVVVALKDANNNVVVQGTFQGKGENNQPSSLLPPASGTVLSF